MGDLALWYKVPYYLLKDAFAEFLQKRVIANQVSELAKQKLFVTITGPLKFGLSDLFSLASRYGVRTVDLASLSESEVRLYITDLFADYIKRDNDFLLVHVPVGKDVMQKMPIAICKVLLLPPAKKYFRKLQSVLSDTEIVLEREYYNSLVMNEDQYNIILNENEMPLDILITLIHKLDCFKRLEQLRKIEYPKSASNYQCFIIWGHGLNYSQQLTEMIGKEYEIISSAERAIGDIKRFTRELYIEEILRVGHHIMKKNQHLSRCPRRAVLLLVRSRQGVRAFDCKGHGTCKTICTTFDQHFKQVIRDKYNPRLSSGERTEYHVIHATDTAFQVDNILRLFELKPLVEWVRGK